MKLSQDRLLAFFEVARLNSFTKAAKAVGITQSALSHRIKNLEHDLRTTLFIRDSSGPRMTEAGTRLLKFCQVQSKLEVEFIQDLTEERAPDLRGALRIGSVSSLAWSIVVPAIGDLLRSNPLIHLDILAREVSELPGLLKRNRVDFLVTVEKISDSGLEERSIGFEKYVLIESANKLTRKDVFLDHEEQDRFTYDFFSHQGQKTVTLVRSFMDDNHGLLAGVKEGVGRAVVPKHLVAANSGVKIIKGFKPLKKPVYLYFTRAPFHTRLAKEATEALSRNVLAILGK